MAIHSRLRVYVSADGVVLIPEDEDESDRWPLAVLALSKKWQQEILYVLRQES